MSRSRPSGSDRAALLQAVREIYAEWDRRPVPRSCTVRTDCCRFRLTGRTPYLTRGEALVAAAAVRASGRRRLPAPPDGSCPLLGRDGRCTIYTARPFACRTHFCRAAGGPAPRHEVRDLIARLEEIDRKLGGAGGVNLPRAVEEAMRDVV